MDAPGVMPSRLHQNYPRERGAHDFPPLDRLCFLAKYRTAFIGLRVFFLGGYQVIDLDGVKS